MLFEVDIRNAYTGKQRTLEINAENHVDAMKVAKRHLQKGECIYGVEGSKRDGKMVHSDVQKQG